MHFTKKILVAAIATVTPVLSVAAIPEAQQLALQAIFNEIHGHGWSVDRQTDWGYDGVGSCFSSMISCDNEENVIGLELVSLPVSSGKLSDQISKLTELQSLYLASTGISTALPSSLTKLSKLQSLHLDAYDYEGPIPTWFGSLSALKHLTITASNFTGEIPNSLGELAALESLTILASDGLIGSIPTELGQLQNMTSLVLSENQLSGSIPHTLGYLHKLEFLDLHNNLLQGSVPSEIYTHPLLDFSLNQLGAQSSVTGNALEVRDDTQILEFPIVDQLAPKWQAQDAKITKASYIGGDQISLEWQVYDWVNNRAVEENLESSSLLDHGFYVYVKSPNEAWIKVATLAGSTNTTWQGSIPNLGEASLLEIQVRRWIGSPNHTINSGSDRAPNESAGHEVSTITFEPSQTINLPPSFIASGDMLNQLPGSKVEIPQWASNLDDGNGNTQDLNFELVYLTNPSLFASTPEVSSPSGTLRFHTANDASGESLVVLKLCDRPTAIQNARACSESVIFTIGVDNPSVPLPSFYSAPSLSTDSAEMQEHPQWANEILASAGQTLHDFEFQTLWIENSELFEKDPWLSTPSGSLRFKFNEGSEGVATMYVHLKDKHTGLYSTIHRIVIKKRINADSPPILSDPAAPSTSRDSSTDALSTTGAGAMAPLLIVLLTLVGFKKKLQN